MIEDLFENEENEDRELEEERDEILHLCFQIRGEAEDCKECNVKRKGLCEKMIRILEKQKMLSGLDREAVKDILSRVIEGITKNINNYQGTSISQFSGFVRKIIMNKRKEYLRGFYQKTQDIKAQDINNWPQLIQQIKNRNSDSVKHIYNEWLCNETKKLIDSYPEGDITKLKSSILKDLNNILNNKNFYNTEKLKDLEIPEEILGTGAVIKRNKTIEETKKINRTLLCLIFPVLSNVSQGKIIEVPIEDDIDIVGTSTEDEDTINVEDILTSLKEVNLNCYKLYLKLYEGFKNGKVQKEIAEERGMRPNTLNKRLERCREKIKELKEKEIL